MRLEWECIRSGFVSCTCKAGKILGTSGDYILMGCRDPMYFFLALLERLWDQRRVSQRGAESFAQGRATLGSTLLLDIGPLEASCWVGARGVPLGSFQRRGSFSLAALCGRRVPSGSCSRGGVGVRCRRDEAERGSRREFLLGGGLWRLVRVSCLGLRSWVAFWHLRRTSACMSRGWARPWQKRCWLEKPDSGLGNGQFHLLSSLLLTKPAVAVPGGISLEKHCFSCAVEWFSSGTFCSCMLS